MTMFELNITRHPNGAVEVTGPVEDKFFCYGLLETARDAIFEHHAKKNAKPAIEVPRMMLHADLPGNGKSQ
jgi:hypothetical protein